MIITCRTTASADDHEVARNVTAVLRERGSMANPPVTLTISDQVALGIADIFRSPTPSGVVFDRFRRTGVIDSDELIDVARIEQGYASPEGHAALYCLIGWVNARVYAAAGRRVHAEAR